jgi:hypothetical protein
MAGRGWWEVQEPLVGSMQVPGQLAPASLG